MPNVKIIGVGNGGMHALDRMIDSDLTGAEFISCSTRKYDLKYSKANKLRLGNLSYGLDGDTPSRSEQAAIESREEILDTLRGADAAIIVAGLGGADGSGASPVVAKYAREVGALTIAAVTLPYVFEGSRRTAKAEVALKNLSANTDVVLKIRNDKFLQMFDPKTPISYAFKVADEILCHAVRTLIAVCQSAFKIDVDKEKILGANAQRLLKINE